ncbi:SDR family NAD(P)-dependent oxidoreductase [Nakamurella lactea]|uniref:SDR family NAD(P)-dependent oxidoreductase n=1 Tax=Nakamurella lactea TaxID=459515 RepID=UPI000409DC42|nr:SDR family oxidoreductase [Nakamurella lactea]
MTPPGSVVVTGAASGIGRAIAQRLAADGYPVAAVDLHVEQLEAVVADLRAAGGRVVAVAGDVRDRDCHRRARAAATELAPLWGWVGCAGITRLHDLTDLDEADAREVVDINQLGLLWGSAEAVDEWTTAGRPGVLLVISSVHAGHAAERHPVYEMTKAAAEALVRSVAVTYGPRGIRAVAVAPGAVDTPALRASMQSAADPAAAQHRLEGFSPAERLARPEEIAAVVAFLLSDQAGYISGTAIPVDGGWTAVLARESQDAEARRRS